MEVFLNGVVIDTASFPKRFNGNISRCVTRLEHVNIVFRNVHICHLKFFLKFLKKNLYHHFQLYCRGEGKDGFKNTNVNFKSDPLWLFYKHCIALDPNCFSNWIECHCQIFCVQNIISFFQNFPWINLKTILSFQINEIYTRSIDKTKIMLVQCKYVPSLKKNKIEKIKTK